MEKMKKKKIKSNKKDNHYTDALNYTMAFDPDIFKDILKLFDSQNKDNYILDFAHESNKIEGINSKEQDVKHSIALSFFLEIKHLKINDITNFVKKVQNGAKLRTGNTIVYVGQHTSPHPDEMISRFDDLLWKINNDKIDPFTAHCMYEYLHPYTDGNGRSGRAIWLWMMNKSFNYKYCESSGQLKFLHRFYYQTLAKIGGKIYNGEI